MAKNLYKLSTRESDKEIVAIIGAGHKKEIIDLLENEAKKDI